MIYNFFVIINHIFLYTLYKKNDCTLNIVHVTATVMSGIIMIARTTIYGNMGMAIFC